MLFRSLRAKETDVEIMKKEKAVKMEQKDIEFQYAEKENEMALKKKELDVALRKKEVELQIEEEKRRMELTDILVLPLFPFFLQFSSHILRFPLKMERYQTSKCSQRGSIRRTSTRRGSQVIPGLSTQLPQTRR